MRAWIACIGMVGLLCVFPSAVMAGTTATPDKNIPPIFFSTIPHTWGQLTGLFRPKPVKRKGILDGLMGVRSALSDYGITLSALYTGEFERNYNPGHILPELRTIYHDNLDLTAALDTGKAGLWPGGTLFLYGLRNNGGQLSTYVIGDLQGASNIEVAPQFIIEEAWYEQKFMHGKIALLAGLRDINNDFYISNYGALFLNSSFGIGPEITVNVPTSTFPKAGLTARIRIRPTRSSYVQLASFDGNPQTRKLDAGEGQMVIAETGFVRPTGRYKIGAWIHTGNKWYDHHMYHGDYGAYILIDQQIATIASSEIGVFAQWGWVPSNRNQVIGYRGVGVHIRAPLPTRLKDTLGLALAQAVTHTGTESTIELTYRARVTSNLAIQPSFQWIISPGGIANAAPIRVGILHFELSL